MPCSPEQLSANRKNSRRSTGPRTEEGKARSRANGLKHGLTGEGTVIPADDAAEVARRSTAMEAEMRPSVELSRALVRRAAALSVRLDRSVRQEFAAVADRARDAGQAFDDRRLTEVEHMLAWVAAEPATYARRLRQTPEGIDGLIRAFLDVRVDLATNDDRRWHSGHLDRLENLVGRRTDDYPTSRTRALFWAILRDFSWLVPEDGTGLTDRERCDWARERMGAWIDEEVEKLRELRKSLDFEAIGRDRAEASDRALFDPSREAILARKYEAATERSLFRTLREVRETEAAAAEVAATPMPEPTPEELASSLPARPRPGPPIPAPPHRPAPTPSPEPSGRRGRPEPAHLQRK